MGSRILDALTSLVHVSVPHRTVGSPLLPTSLLLIGYHDRGSYVIYNTTISYPIANKIIYFLLDITCINSITYSIMTTMQSRYFNMRESGDYMGCSLSTVQKLRKKKLLPYSKVGRRVFIDVDDIRSTLEKLNRRLVKIHDHSGTRPKLSTEKTDSQ
jgi:Helix-turn-helix domain